MKTLVFNSGNFRDLLNAGLPLLYPLIKDGRMQLISEDRVASLPFVSLPELSHETDVSHDTPWQAVILVPEKRHWCASDVSLGAFVHRIKNEQLSCAMELMGKPERTWTILTTSNNPESQGTHFAAINYLDRFGYLSTDEDETSWFITEREVASLNHIWTSVKTEVAELLEGRDGITKEAKGILDQTQESIFKELHDLTNQKASLLPPELAGSLFNAGNVSGIADQFKKKWSHQYELKSAFVGDNRLPERLVKNILKEEFSLESSHLKNNYFISLERAALANFSNPLPVLLSLISQWNSLEMTPRERYWSLSDIFFDVDQLSQNLNIYQQRLIAPLKIIQGQLTSPLSVRIELIDKISGKTSSQFRPHEELKKPLIQSLNDWHQWYSNTGNELKEYLEKGHDHVSTIGNELRQAKSIRQPKEIEDLDKEITVKETQKESLWQYFRSQQFKEPGQIWDKRSGSTKRKIEEVLSCRPTPLQRWLTILCGAAIFSLPLILMMLINLGNWQLIKQNDFIFSISFVVITIAIICFFLYLQTKRKLNRLVQKTCDIANEMLKETNEQIGKNTSYLHSAFNMSAAEQDLSALKKARKTLMQSRERMIWLENEIKWHLDWAQKTSPGTSPPSPSSSTANTTDLDRATTLPPSYNPFFMLPAEQPQEIKIQMGTAETQFLSPFLPGMKQIKFERAII